MLFEVLSAYGLRAENTYHVSDTGYSTCFPDLAHQREPRQIDYIFTRGFPPGTATCRTEDCHATVSDHLPNVLRLKVHDPASNWVPMVLRPRLPPKPIGWRSFDLNGYRDEGQRCLWCAFSGKPSIC